MAYYGPFGLFLGWLMIMFLYVVAVHASIFITKVVLVGARLFARAIELVGAWFPSGG